MAQFETREYERNHGHRPRGEGQWAFMPMDEWRGTVSDNVDEWVFTPCMMSYSEAKRWVEDNHPTVSMWSVGP